jgi:hypothetical protein
MKEYFDKSRMVRWMFHVGQQETIEENNSLKDQNVGGNNVNGF